MNTISILGCGWLGLPLAEHLIEAGYIIKGSTRTRADLGLLESKGISPYLLVLDPEIKGENLDKFFDSNVLVINFPPERREDIVEYHKIQAISLINKIKSSPIEKVIFVSSTSVYPDLNREVTEDDISEPSKESGKALLKFESLLSSSAEFKTTILRFAGLIGYDRKPGRFLAGKREVRNGEAPVNLIHRDDCISIVEQIIEKDIWGETFNACSDIHPKRKDYYIGAANKLGLSPPNFIEEKSYSYKVINSDKLKRMLGYSFKYPDPSAINDE